MPIKFIVTRLVTPEECKWLERYYLPGETLFQCVKHDYGCVNPKNGFAATQDSSGDYPFFEFPHDAVKVVN